MRYILSLVLGLIILYSCENQESSYPAFIEANEDYTQFVNQFVSEEGKKGFYSTLSMNNMGWFALVF